MNIGNIFHSKVYITCSYHVMDAEIADSYDNSELFFKFTTKRITYISIMYEWFKWDGSQNPAMILVWFLLLFWHIASVSCLTKESWI